MANARIKFYLYDCTEPEFEELRRDIIKMLERSQRKLSGNVHIDSVEDRRKESAEYWKGEERRQKQVGFSITQRRMEKGE